MPVNGQIDRVVGHRKNPKGPGEQYEVLWVGQNESTWEAASRMRTQVPLLVRANVWYAYGGPTDARCDASVRRERCRVGVVGARTVVPL